MKKSDAVFKVAVSVGNTTREYPLGHEAIRSLLWSSSDMQADAFFWNALAAHPSSELRAEAVEVTDFSGDLYRLLKDPSVDVRAAVIDRGPTPGLDHIEPDELLHLIRTDDIKVVKSIARNLDWFDGEGLNDAMDLPCKHPDLRCAKASPGTNAPARNAWLR